MLPCSLLQIMWEFWSWVGKVSARGGGWISFASQILGKLPCKLAFGLLLRGYQTVSAISRDSAAMWSSSHVNVSPKGLLLLLLYSGLVRTAVLLDGLFQPT